MNFKMIILFFVILGLFSTFSAFGDEDICNELDEDNLIVVTTDKEKYDSGDTIIVSGCLAKDAQTKGVNVNILNPEGQRIAGTTFVPSEGFFSETFVIDDEYDIDGTYSVEIDAAGLFQATKTFVVPEFGTIVLLILTIGIVTSIYLTKTRFTKIF